MYAAVGGTHRGRVGAASEREIITVMPTVTERTAIRRAAQPDALETKRCERPERKVQLLERDRRHDAVHLGEQ